LLAKQVHRREITWQKGHVTPAERAAQYHHKGKFVVVVGEPHPGLPQLAKQLESRLFREGVHTYYLSLSNVFDCLGGTDESSPLAHEEQLRRLGELARLVTDAGLVFITALENADQHDLAKLKLLNEPHELFVVCRGDETPGSFPVNVQLSPKQDQDEAIQAVLQALKDQGVTPDYSI